MSNYFFQKIQLMSGTSQQTELTISRFYHTLITTTTKKKEKQAYFLFVFVGTDGWLKCDTTPIGFSILPHAG